MNRKKRTTTRDIAKACFVSQSAVSMILSGREDIHFAPDTGILSITLNLPKKWDTSTRQERNEKRQERMIQL